MKIAIMTIVVFVMICVQAAAGSLSVVLLDLSGSVLKDNNGQQANDSPFNNNMSELKRQINQLGKGETIIVVGFGRKSNVTLLKATMPKQAGPMNKNLSATREAAIKKLLENIRDKAGAVDKSRTDVIGGIYRASRLFSEAGEVERKQLTLTLYSDMLDNETAGLSINSLKAQGSHNRLLKRLEGKIGYPDLKGVDINLFSVFTDIEYVNTVETEVAIRELKHFWGEYFRRSGGIVKSFRTSY